LSSERSPLFKKKQQKQQKQTKVQQGGTH